MNLSALINDYLEYLELEKNSSQKTIRNYDHYLKRFIDFVYNSIENGGFEVDDGFISVEDKDKAFRITCFEQLSLRFVREDIGELLKVSIKLGLHLNPYEYVYEHKNGRVTKNISEFILELNARYPP